MLEATNLSAEFRGSAQAVRAVRGVDLKLNRSEKVAIVGESGSGKSTLALSLLGLIEPPGYITGGEVWLNGRRLVLTNDRQMDSVRGKEISLIFQDPMAALDPVKRIGAQVEEAIQRHQRGIGWRALRSRAMELLREVELPDVSSRFDDYPHQYSGGMRQRVMIAIALANNPDVVIADEPTTALDVTTQAQVLDLLQRLVDERHAAVILITHNFGIVADFCDVVYVMYAGRFVERASVEDIFGSPTHPYTEALLRSAPRPGELNVVRLFAIPGSPPDLRHLTNGCSFAPRCPQVQEICLSNEPIPGLHLERQGRPIVSECHFAEKRLSSLGRRHIAPVRTDPAIVGEQATSQPNAQPGNSLVDVADLTKVFSERPTWLRGQRQIVRAVDGVSLRIGRGETFGIVGESGCGKSTVARCLVRLLEPTAGRILFEGVDVAHLNSAELRPLRRKIQIVFQDPSSSLDPRMSVHSIVEEPLRIHGSQVGQSRRSLVEEMLALVGLPVERSQFTPHAFSGGQQQRIAIARALILRPKFVVLDEPISSLDVSIQAQILNLLNDLQDELGLTYLFITHDLLAAEFFCDRIAVLYLGQIVEVANHNELFRHPLHPYTVALTSALPVPDPAVGQRQRVILQGEVVRIHEKPTGCPFRSRCPVGHNREVCRTEPPPLRAAAPDHSVACHFAGELSVSTAHEFGRVPADA